MSDLRPGAQILIDWPEFARYHNQYATLGHPDTRHDNTPGHHVTLNDDDTPTWIPDIRIRNAGPFQPGDRIRVDWPFDLNDGRTGHVTATGLRRLAEPACQVRFDDDKSRMPGAVNDVPVPCRNLILVERPGPAVENLGEPT